MATEFAKIFASNAFTRQQVEALRRLLSYIEDLIAAGGGGGGGGGVTDHGALTGLSDNDHPQYLRTERTATASETLAAGEFVNVWDDAGTAKVRLADASAYGKRAHGYVLAAVSSGATATYYTDGVNTALSGMTPGATQYLSTAAGGRTQTAPSTIGEVRQELGIAVSATDMVVFLGPDMEIVA